MKFIERRSYLDKLINVMGTLDIKVITGVRCSGKSKLLDAFKKCVVKENPDCNIIEINFNLPDFDELLAYRPLYDYVNKNYAEGKENFVSLMKYRCVKILKGQLMDFTQVRNMISILQVPMHFC